MALTVRPQRRTGDPTMMWLAAAALDGCQPVRRQRADVPPPPAGWLTGLLLCTLIAAPALIVIQNRDAAGAPVETCPPVVYAVDASLADPGVTTELAEALAELAAMTGITFERVADAGTAAVRIAWVPRREIRALVPQRGLLAVTAVPGDEPGPRGRMMFDADAELPFHEGPGGWRALIRHELGHLLGLDHSRDRRDLMYPYLDRGPGAWSPDEEERLRSVGKRLGC